MWQRAIGNYRAVHARWPSFHLRCRLGVISCMRHGMQHDACWLCIARVKGDLGPTVQIHMFAGDVHPKTMDRKACARPDLLCNRHQTRIALNS